MAKKASAKPTVASPRLKSSSLLDTRVVYCGDCHASHYVKVMLNAIAVK
jgi:hypothetical protein